jgi:hypothetical protein
MGVVDYAFYSGIYMGTEATQASFPALCARASDVIGAVTHWVDDATIQKLPAALQTLYKKAICAQVDFLVLNGDAILYENGTGGGFTVGKVTVQGKGNTSGGRLSESICPLAIGYLEQTGLMNPQVPTFDGWW